MSGHGSKLTRKMHVAVAALLTAPTEAAAAAQAGVGVATLRRWKQREDFRAELRAASRALLDETAAKLRAGAGQALDVLREAFDEPHPATRVRAAIAWLTLANQIEVDDLARRVEALEARTQDDAR